MILVVSLRNDLHALAVADRIRSEHGVPCHILEADDLIGSESFAWSGDGGRPATVPVRGGEAVDLSEVDVVWWRRAKMPQLTDDDPYSFENAFATSEWQSAVLGAVTTDVRGHWVSDPAATAAGSNKLIQLRAAAASGWTIPETLVSQDPAAVDAFCRAAPGGEVVAKALTAVRGRTMAAVAVAPDQIAAADVSVAPAIYQHVVPGMTHLRINVFGDRVVAFEISSPLMDWRRDFAAPVRAVQLDSALEQRCVDVVRALGLEMGVIDAKPLPDGDTCFLEVNPQGQFLFLEGATGVDVTGALAEFLCERARAHA